MRFRLIKPDWAKLPENSVPGPNSIDGDDFSEDFLRKQNELGYGIYYFPNYNSKPIQGNYTSGRDIDVFQYVYVDMDLKDGKYSSKEQFVETLLNFPCLPNKIVDSGNGIHAYWRITDLSRERFVSLQLRLIKQFKTDEAIWTVLRCMRLEGYYNTKKKDEFKIVEFDVPTENPYQYKDLLKHLPQLDDKDETKMANHLRKIDGLAPVDELSDVDVESIPERFEKLFEKSKKVQDLFTDETPGNRSDRDYQLCCILYENNFSKKEALAVIANTPKSRALGSTKMTYVMHTVDKVYKSKSKFVVESAATKLARGTDTARRGKQVYGPYYFDNSHKGWRTQQCLGLVGGTGIGKSTVTLDIFMGMIENNPTSDDIYIYFNLEMPDWEIIEKWAALTRKDPKMAERLFVVSNEDEEGNPRNINLQQISWYCNDIQKSTGKKIAAIAIDHIGVINPTIDITKKPDFGLQGDVEGAFGNFRNVSPRKMPQLIKELAKQLDCFIIIQSQTTKAKGMDGDTPLGVDAAYGASQFEQYMDYIITLWQPLRRVHHKTELRALGWQYCKIRSKSKEDKSQVYSPEVLNVDINTGKLTPLSIEEHTEFSNLDKEATVLRKRAEKKETIEYKVSPGLSKLIAITSAKA